MKLAFFKRDIPKRPAIAIALALVTAASLVIGSEKPALEVVESRPARTENAAPGLEIDLAKLRRGEADAPQNNPFAPRNFAPAPRAQASTAATSAPKAAPPLPFTYVGWVSQDGKTEVYVLRGEELISIEAGQKIEPGYRVDSIDDSSIRFTYLPMKTRQVLARVAAEGENAAQGPQAAGEQKAAEEQKAAQGQKAAEGEKAG